MPFQDVEPQVRRPARGQPEDIKKVMIIGSGPIIIGQACEFDYSGTQACKALRSLGYKIVLVNSNPATIMTDPGMADATYIEPLNLETMIKIIEKERPDAILPNLGGQTGLNLSSALAESGALEKYNVKVIGVEPEAIKRGEDRLAFKETMKNWASICLRARLPTASKMLKRLPPNWVIRWLYVLPIPWVVPAAAWSITWRNCGLLPAVVLLPA